MLNFPVEMYDSPKGELLNVIGYRSREARLDR